MSNISKSQQLAREALKRYLLDINEYHEVERIPITLRKEITNSQLADEIIKEVDELIRYLDADTDMLGGGV